MKRPPTLEISWLRAFITAADTRSFTGAGSAIGATQSAVSVRIRKLEARLGQKLLERNAHAVTLTRAGATFLPDARRLLQLHDDAALRAVGTARAEPFEIGVSDHAAGQLLPGLLAPLQERFAGRQLAVTVGNSKDLLLAFEQGRFDIVIGRSDDVGDGETLLVDKLVWVASPKLKWRPDEPLPFVSLSAPCGIRETAINALTARGVSWRATFIGTGVAAIQAAIAAGFGVACLETRNAPPGCRILGNDARLPALPSTRVVLRRRDGADATIADALARAIKHSPRGRTRERPRVHRDSR